MPTPRPSVWPLLLFPFELEELEELDSGVGELLGEDVLTVELTEDGLTDGLLDVDSVLDDA